MKVTVHKNQSQKIGQLLSKYQVKKEFLSRPILNINTKDELKLRAFFYAVAICHHTYTLSDSNKNIFGWDVIEDRFYNLLKSKSKVLTSGYFINKTIEEVSLDLIGIFKTNDKDDFCTLDRLDERSKFLIEVDCFFYSKYRGRIRDYIKETDNKLINGSSGHYKLLSTIEAFSDPFSKKISFLLKLLLNSNQIEIKDIDNYIPIMDYHMMRVLLRLGCVEVKDQDLYNSLVSKEIVTDDSQIRDACIKSMKIIAEISNHTIPSMNDFFWTLGRSCCNEKPLCKTSKCEKNPCSLSYVIDIDSKKHDCIFERNCFGIKDDKYIKLWQPNIVTHYY